MLARRLKRSPRTLVGVQLAIVLQQEPVGHRYPSGGRDVRAQEIAGDVRKWKIAPKRQHAGRLDTVFAAEVLTSSCNAG
jgi:hypothetical protein